MSVHVTQAKYPRPSAVDELLDGLNPQQRQAVVHQGSPLLIVAGAGSGKTAVLTRRIAYLIAERGVSVGQILAITFTNKAAAEMRERVVNLVGDRARYMWVSTFHSSCVRILRNQASLIEGLNSNFSIYDADDSRRLLQMIGRDMGLDIKRYSPRLLANAISNLKNELIDPHQAVSNLTDESDDLARTVASVFGEYQRRLRAANALDFDDLIGETVGVLQTFSDIAQYYRRRFRHVLVDEYQDTNHAQYMLVRELVGHGSGESDDEVPPAELCVVGDADQSIYAFRGATIRNIEDFERDYPDVTTILLEQNYRSTQNILSAANSVIARNAGRREKRLWTDAGEGELIVGYVADNEHDEARFVADEIDALADRGDITYNDVAVFYRTNNSSRSLEEVFIRAGIPYKVVGGVRFYERKEIRDIVAYLRVLDNPGDAVSMRRILNTPRRGIGDRAEACVAVYAENTGASFADALQAAAEGKVPMLNTRAEKCIAGFVELLDELRGHLDDDLGELVEAVLERTGYRRELESSTDPQELARLDNLNELVSVAHEFSTDLALETSQAAALVQDAPENEDVPDTGVLAAFLERVSLVADTDEIPEHGSGLVTLMTLHTAKGLEFPVVFVTGWEDGMFPHMRALDDPMELSEERRLAYVGITRARQRLYVSRAIVRSSWGQPMLNPESRFLREIPQQLIDWRRVAPKPSFSAPVSGAGRFGTPRAAPTRSGASKRPLVVLEPGDRVTHDKYGLGRVEEVSGVGESAMSLIDFGSAGRVKLMHNHAPISKL